MRCGSIAGTGGSSVAGEQGAEALASAELGALEAACRVGGRRNVIDAVGILAWEGSDRERAGCGAALLLFALLGEELRAGVAATQSENWVSSVADLLPERHAFRSGTLWWWAW